MVTTERDTACAGGAAAGRPALAPSTLVFAGATAAVEAIGALAAAAALTGTAAFATGCELVMALAGTAVMAPGTVWFA